MSPFLHTGSNFRTRLCGATPFDVAFPLISTHIWSISPHYMFHHKREPLWTSLLEGDRICVEHLMRETWSLSHPGVDGAGLGGLLDLYLCWTHFSIAFWWLQSTRYLQITFPYDLITKWLRLNILAYNFHVISRTMFTIPCKKLSTTDAGALKIGSSSIFWFLAPCFLAVLCFALGNGVIGEEKIVLQ